MVARSDRWEREELNIMAIKKSDARELRLDTQADGSVTNDKSLINGGMVARQVRISGWDGKSSEECHQTIITPYLGELTYVAEATGTLLAYSEMLHNFIMTWSVDGKRCHAKHRLRDDLELSFNIGGKSKTNVLIAAVLALICQKMAQPKKEFFPWILSLTSDQGCGAFEHFMGLLTLLKLLVFQGDSPPSALAKPLLETEAPADESDEGCPNSPRWRRLMQACQNCCSWGWSRVRCNRRRV